MVQKRKLKVTILALMILVMTLMASHHVLAADAGTRDDALKWVYANFLIMMERMVHNV